LAEKVTIAYKGRNPCHGVKTVIIVLWRMSGEGKEGWWRIAVKTAFGNGSLFFDKINNKI